MLTSSSAGDQTNPHNEHANKKKAKKQEGDKTDSEEEEEPPRDFTLEQLRDFDGIKDILIIKLNSVL